MQAPYSLHSEDELVTSLLDAPSDSSQNQGSSKGDKDVPATTDSMKGVTNASESNFDGFDSFPKNNLSDDNSLTKERDAANNEDRRDSAGSCQSISFA